MATISPVILWTAMIDGSSTTIPRPRTAMIVEVDPMSIAIESETRSRNALKRKNEDVFRMIMFATAGKGRERHQELIYQKRGHHNSRAVRTKVKAEKISDFMTSLLSATYFLRQANMQPSATFVSVTFS